MTINSQVSTIEPKNTKQQQKNQKQKHTKQTRTGTESH